ncbi:hypothetical protein, partial [Escherichia coli]|uniref:hypothetical protein n=1 Tax=Escherichia coli TaxID=562 RepID=UPI001954FA18
MMLGFLKEPPPFFGAVVLPRSAIIGRPRRSSGCREADSAAFGADVRMPPGRLCADFVEKLGCCSGISEVIHCRCEAG